MRHKTMFDLLMEMFQRPMAFEKSKRVETSRTVEWEVNGKKTTFTVGFDKDGEPVSVECKCEYIPTPEEELQNRIMLLEKQIEEELEKDTSDGYLKAGELKRQLEEIRK